MSEEAPKSGAVAGGDPDKYSYDNLSKMRKNSVYLVSLLLVINGIMKIASIGKEESVRSFIMTFYFCGIGIILILIELERGQVQ